MGLLFGTFVLELWFGTFVLELLFGTFVWDLCVGTLLGNFVWEICVGTLVWEISLGLLLGNFSGSWGTRHDLGGLFFLLGEPGRRRRGNRRGRRTTPNP